VVEPGGLGVTVTNDEDDGEGPRDPVTETV